MTKIKKIAASILAAASISAMGITSFAATTATATDYKDVYYSFSLSPWKSQFISQGVKQDSSGTNYAKVYTEDGNLSDNVYVQFDIFDGYDGNLISETVKATRNNSSYSIDYTESRGENSISVLRATAGRYSVYSTGYWRP